jgi:thiol-disulfide isomerase/thioredoxin
MELAMVPSRLNCRPASPLAAAMSAMLFFAVASCSSSVAPTTVRAEDSKSDAKADDADPDFDIPDGTPTEIMEFIDKLKGKRPKFANRQEAINHAIKMQRALIAAGDKILNQKSDEKEAVAAAQMKLGALTLLAANRIGDSPKEAMAAAIKLKADEREPVAKVVEQFWTPIRIFNVPTMAAAERKELAVELIAAVSTSKFSRESIGAASQLGDVLADTGNTEEAGELFERLAKVATESDDPKFQPNAERFSAIARRLRLPGHFMALEGKLLAGGELDWAAYRGKVVLVDFWATWCGPCIGELPNVKENYKKYHDKGFDVVAISLDRSREPLDKFIEKEEIPWTQLYDADIQKGTGWNHPMARHYGISAIPAAILVDKDGKVVSMAARGEELTKQLEKLLGKVE